MTTIDTVASYVAASRRDPRLTRTTLHYIADMIDYFGKAKVFEGIYGMDRQLDDIVAFFKGYAMSMERRLLLLVGPQGSGKSMTVDKIKRRLEEYSRKPDGAVYGEVIVTLNPRDFLAAERLRLMVRSPRQAVLDL